jgi:hypothetical protein
VDLTTGQPNQRKDPIVSWTVPCPSSTAESIEASARSGYEHYRSTYSGGDAGELDAMDEQFEAALAAASGILASGAVGDTACSVTLSGHANPHHAKRPGYANDAIVVSITQH